MLKDPDTNLVKEVYAVIYSPKQNRKRFPENCVEVFASAEEALAAEEPDKHKYAAKVLGPSRSSEGFMLYYLEHWL